MTLACVKFDIKLASTPCKCLVVCLLIQPQKVEMGFCRANCIGGFGLDSGIQPL